MKCKYCERVDLLTKDHIIPRAKGGTDRHSNIALVCMKCNCIKGNLYPLDFIANIDITLHKGFTELIGFTREELTLIRNNLSAILVSRDIEPKRDPKHKVAPFRFKRTVAKNAQKKFRQSYIEIRSRQAPKDKQPVGLLVERLEFSDYEPAEPGHPVYEQDEDRYRIFVKKKRQLSPTEVQTVEIRYYKSTLNKIITHV